MRTFSVIIAVLAFASSAQAQRLAQVETVAHVRVPDFLILQTGEVTQTSMPDGKQVRRVVVYVTANRAWMLSVARDCSSGCSEAEYRVSVPAGKAGNAQRVVIEYVWRDGARAPAPEEFQYLLVGA